MFERRAVTGADTLVQQASRLYLGVLSVGIGEQLLPDHAVGGESPYPYFLARLIGVFRRVAESEPVVVPVAAPEVRVFARDMV